MLLLKTTWKIFLLLFTLCCLPPSQPFCFTLLFSFSCSVCICFLRLFLRKKMAQNPKVYNVAVHELEIWEWRIWGSVGLNGSPAFSSILRFLSLNHPWRPHGPTASSIPANCFPCYTFQSLKLLLRFPVKSCTAMFSCRILRFPILGVAVWSPSHSWVTSLNDQRLRNKPCSLQLIFPIFLLFPGRNWNILLLLNDFWIDFSQ